MANRNTHLCLCFSGVDYDECCWPYHMGKKTVESAERLIRTRYTAYCHGDVGYLVSTIHPGARRFGISRTIRKTIKNTRWAGLKIINSKEEDNKAYVDYIAFHLTNNLEQFHEKARLIKYKDEWYFADSESLPPVRFSRNDPCYCGSGKKFKKCHGTLISKATDQQG